MSATPPEERPQATTRDADLHPIKRGRIGFNVTLQVALALVLFGIVNYLSFRHYQRWDLSHNRDYTLSGTTVGFLGSLKEDARIVVAFVRGSDIFEDVRILVEEYARNSGGRVEVEFVDPARAPGRAEELKNRYNFLLDRNSLIVDVADRTKFLYEEDLASYSENEGGSRRLVNFHGENALTSALIAVTENERRHLYLIAGKGVFRQAEDGTDASAVLLDLASKQNITALGLNLADVTEVPANADGVIIYNPQIDFTERELRMLREYWESSRGALLVMRNPSFDTPRLDAFLARFGIRPRQDRVLFSQSTPAGPQKEFSVRNNFVPGSPVTQSLLGKTTAFAGQTSSLALAENADELRQDTIVVTPLLEATPRFWGETDYLQALPRFDEGRDHAPPIYTAAAVERGAVEDPVIRIDSSRMAVVANATLLDPDSLAVLNYDFTSNVLNWLLDRDALIGIPPKAKETFRLDIPPDQRSRIFWLVAVILPAGVMCLGLFVWTLRRV